MGDVAAPGLVTHCRGARTARRYEPMAPAGAVISTVWTRWTSPAPRAPARGPRLTGPTRSPAAHRWSRSLSPYLGGSCFPCHLSCLRPTHDEKGHGHTRPLMSCPRHRTIGQKPSCHRCQQSMRATRSPQRRGNHGGNRAGSTCTTRAASLRNHAPPANRCARDVLPQDTGQPPAEIPLPSLPLSLLTQPHTAKVDQDLTPTPRSQRPRRPPPHYPSPPTTYSQNMTRRPPDTPCPPATHRPTTSTTYAHTTTSRSHCPTFAAKCSRTPHQTPMYSMNCVRLERGSRSAISLSNGFRL